MSVQTGHSTGKEHTLAPQRGHMYPPRLGFEWLSIRRKEILGLPCTERRMSLVRSRRKTHHY